jgi:hypothetical protein
MTAPTQLSDEELYQQLGSWEAAAAARDAQNNALNEYNWSQSTPANTQTSTPSLLDELKALYAEKGATERTEYETEGGTQYYDNPIQYLDGWTAWEKQPQIIGFEGDNEIREEIDPADKLGGFQRSEDGKNYYYDTTGKLIHVEKESSFWDDFGPMIMTAATMGGGAGLLGSTLFPSLGATAAAGAGGALLGGANAALTDQNILKGALLGGAGSAGALELGDTGLKLGDVSKAVNFAQNPTLAGAANLASPYVGSVDLGDTGVSLNDVMKGVGTAQALSSGNPMTIMKTIAGLSKDQGGSLKSSLFEANPDDFIEGYFQPGGEGYIDPASQEMTVREDPENLDALLRSLSPYQVDGGTSIFAQDEDIPEMETVSKRPITSLADLFGDTDIMQTVDADVPELTITGDRPVSESNSLRTKDIVSDIPDEIITADQIDTLFPGYDFNQILQTIAPPGAKVATPAKPAAPGTKTTQQTLADLGLGGMQQSSSQDPYADIKLMEELFGADIAYKLQSLGGDKRK